MGVRWIPAVTVAVAFVGCSSDVMGPAGDATPVSARVAQETVVIENNAAATRYYWLIERETSHLVDPGWASGDLSAYPTLAPGASISIPLSEVDGYHSGATELWLATFTGVEFVSRFGLPGQWLPVGGTQEVITLSAP